MPENLYANNLELIDLAKEGDAEARDRLVENNVGLARSIASRFTGRGVDYEDLVQIGVIGIIKAVNSFDRSFGTAFSTYAVPMVIGEIKRFLRDDALIKVSRDTRRRGAMIMRLMEEHRRAHSREMQVSELAAATGLSPEEVVYAMEASSPVHSLQEYARADEDGASLGDFIDGGDDGIERAVDGIALREAIARLPELQRRLISLRYYRNLSQQQTARLLGVTQVKVSREEKRIFAQLRLMLG